MGATDAAEMLEAAKAECVRLERIIGEALVLADTIAHPEFRLARMVAVLEKAKGESGGTGSTPSRPALTQHLARSAAARERGDATEQGVTPFVPPAEALTARKPVYQVEHDPAIASVNAAQQMIVQAYVRGAGLLSEMTIGLLAGESISIAEADRRMQMRARS